MLVPHFALYQRCDVVSDVSGLTLLDTSDD